MSLEGGREGRGGGGEGEGRGGEGRGGEGRGGEGRGGEGRGGEGGEGRGGEGRGGEGRGGEGMGGEGRGVPLVNHEQWYDIITFDVTWTHSPGHAIKLLEAGVHTSLSIPVKLPLLTIYLRILVP